ncbi:MAG: type II secretion system F family protein [Firmicutes bacterium]|nr:type II secretion system F family protein [Bacillota bacterium]
MMVDQVRIYAKAVGHYTALKIVAGPMKGPLGREMKVMSAEMELVGLLEAVNNFAARCGVPEVVDFARIIKVEQATGAEISQILLNYSSMARQRMTSNIKRKIKVQPILMSILPGILVIIFMMMFIVPMVTSIIQQINSIK